MSAQSYDEVAAAIRRLKELADQLYWLREDEPTDLPDFDEDSFLSMLRGEE